MAIFVFIVKLTKTDNVSFAPFAQTRGAVDGVEDFKGGEAFKVIGRGHGHSNSSAKRGNMAHTNQKFSPSTILAACARLHSSQENAP
jgi:hypothetical protein